MNVNQVQPGGVTDVTPQTAADTQPEAEMASNLASTRQATSADSITTRSSVCGSGGASAPDFPTLLTMFTEDEKALIQKVLEDVCSSYMRYEANTDGEETGPHKWGELRRIATSAAFLLMAYKQDYFDEWSTLSVVENFAKTCMSAEQSALLSEIFSGRKGLKFRSEFYMGSPIPTNR
ncbi:hypothetical protein LXM60_16235 [Pandoraea sputorum]|uniref:hypothetical protein n=1 Tax=Pandoraea sputorum TaxID=93222 RepID=UPI001E63EF55|nr:hypothetical protein [Pandoraea sputorum]MCE4061753.1 hypothetical protein [Pandoraea sputorum]